MADCILLISFEGNSRNLDFLIAFLLCYKTTNNYKGDGFDIVRICILGRELLYMHFPMNKIESAFRSLHIILPVRC